jgi:SAM-dependent methyltransferase
LNRAIYRSLAHSVSRLVADRRLTPRDVVDIGFGTGEWLDFWLARGAEVAGIDLTETAVARGRKRYPGVELFRADIAAALPTDRRFDAVSAMNVLLHITDDGDCRRALENLRRLVRDGGVLLLAEPIVTQRYAPPPDRSATSVARTLEWWRAALRETGFEIIELRPATCVLGNPVDAPGARAFRSHLRLWLGLGRVVGDSERRAHAAGALLYPLDRLLARVLRHGPSGKLLLARAVQSSASS